ncbi:Tn3 family transposase, partial [Klebsiella pneumoniae]|nr:Tn3 family transposase [Klebsiella pneumoniae]MCQ8512957.1 Tn3 family transposase [Klebsiella pneumoniae]MCQ8528211.1 Tn3 family transposase [Klebsiella pneumoniae]MCQ8584716.1 Tn3 family transposase [Klebsiella pneumoniae]
YMQAALDHLRAQGETLNDEDIARLSPLCHGHIRGQFGYRKLLYVRLIF